jgi:hypothetical protein
LNAIARAEQFLSSENSGFEACSETIAARRHAEAKPKETAEPAAKAKPKEQAADEPPDLAKPAEPADAIPEGAAAGQVADAMPKETGTKDEKLVVTVFDHSAE